LHGDRHGLQAIPLDIAARIPAAAARIQKKEDAIIQACQSPHFSLEKLRETFGNQ